MRAASAQPLNPTINPNAAPIQVTQAQEKIAARPTVADRTLVNIAFGGTALAGNTDTYAANLGGRFGLNRDRHQLTIEALGTLGKGRLSENGPFEWTSRSALARVRYDLFLSRADALFIALAPRRDTFAGINIRLQNQIGYSRNVFSPSDLQRLWLELGYDYTYDYLTKETSVTDDITREVRTAAPELAPEGTTSITRTIKTREGNKSEHIHSARVFFGYTNRVFSSANVSLGVETLLDIRDKKNTRVNALAEFTSSVTQSFKLGVQSRLMYDAEPVPGKNSKDLIAAVQLVYTFDSMSTVTSAPCPACDCTSMVEEAKKACLAELSKKTAEGASTPVPTEPPKPAQ